MNCTARTGTSFCQEFIVLVFDINVLMSGSDKKVHAY